MNLQIYWKTWKHSSRIRTSCFPSSGGSAHPPPDADPLWRQIPLQADPPWGRTRLRQTPPWMQTLLLDAHPLLDTHPLRQTLLHADPPWGRLPLEADPLEADPPGGRPMLVLWPVMHAGKPTPHPMDRQTPGKTLPSRNFVCGR